MAASDCMNADGPLLAAASVGALLLPGLALYYGGLVRRKHLLGSMMQVWMAGPIVGLVWLLVGFPLTCPQGTAEGARFAHLFSVNDPGSGSTWHASALLLFQGVGVVFAAGLLSGAAAERLRFHPAAWHLAIWSLLVQIPLLWGLASAPPLDAGGSLSIHTCAGWSALALALALGRRRQVDGPLLNPGSLALAISGAGLMAVGWLGHFHGSLVLSGRPLGGLASAWASACAGALTWMGLETWRCGRATPLGLASGGLAGLVGIAAALGLASPAWGLAIGSTTGLAVYLAMWVKGRLGIDDTLDVFALHGIGGVVGVLWSLIWSAEPGRLCLALTMVASGSCAATWLLTQTFHLLWPMRLSADEEAEGLDRSQHGQVGFDAGPDLPLGSEGASTQAPRPATSPPAQQRYALVVDGAPAAEVSRVWTELCQVGAEPLPDFLRVYEHLTTMSAGYFRFRGGDPDETRQRLERLLRDRLGAAHLRVRREALPASARRAA